MKFPIRLGKFKSTRILAGASGLLLALTLVAAFVSPVSAVPQQAHLFFGTVYIDSVPAPAGTEVVARIANVTQNFTTAVAANHTYGWSPVFHVLGDDPATPEKEGGNDGDTIDFYVAGIWATNFTFKSGDHDELNLSVGVITAATLEGHVSFTGRGSAPNSRWIEGFVVRFFQNGNETAWSPINATTDDTGVFVIHGIIPGTYDISIKNWTCLSELVTNQTLTAGNTTVVNFGTTREGDADGNDAVTGMDFSLLAGAFMSIPAYPNWNPNCDFNRNNAVTGKDFSLLSDSFDQTGDLA